MKPVIKKIEFSKAEQEEIDLINKGQTVPKTLYHGTTALRCTMINKDELLRCNMPKSVKAEEYLDIYLNKGYVYFTNHLDEAVMFGLIKSLLDKRANDLEQYMKLNPNYRDSVVLGINRSELGYNLDIDPESNSPLTKEMQDLHNSQWYRYKGDIKLKHLSVYKHVPFGTFSSDLITEFMKCIEEKFHRYQSIMNNRFASQSIMKQLFAIKIPKIGMTL